MRRSKADVERYIASVQSASPGQKAKPVKGFLFAKLYYDAKEYELAKRQVSEYLCVQPKDPKAHKFLGQLFEREGDVDKAVGCYKRSVDLNPAQPDVVLKVAELLCGKPEPDSRAEFWVERAGRLLPGHPSVFSLRERLLSARDGSNQLYELLQAELRLRPADVHINTRLVRVCVSEGRLQEALQHCLQVERAGLLRQSLQWSELLVSTLQEYVAQPSVVSSDQASRKFHKELLLAHCNLLRLRLGEKSCADAVDALWSLDCALQALRNTALSAPDELAEVFVEVRAQLYVSAGTLLLKMAQDGLQQWRAVRDLAALCFLVSYQAPRPKARGLKADAAREYLELQACARQSLSGHMLLNMSADEHTLLKDVVEVFGSCSGTKLFHALYSTHTDHTLSFIYNDDVHVSPHTPTAAELSKCDSGAVCVCAGDLQQLAWLGLQWALMGPSVSLQPWLRQLFPRLTLETSKLDTSAPESLCLLDLEVFVCGVVFCSGAQLKERACVSPPQHYEPRCLPPALLKRLSSDTQTQWWDAVYSLVHKRAPPGASARLRVLVQQGLGTLRAGEKHGLQPALLIHWARHLSRTGERVNSFYDQKEYLERSAHYWRSVLPLLERIRSKRGVPEPLEPLFPHFSSRDVGPAQVRALQDEAGVCFAALLDIEGHTEQAIAKLEKLNSVASNWHLAKIYQRLSEEAGSGVEETQGRCTSFLLQFRKYLTKIYQASAEDMDKCPVSMEEVLELLGEVSQRLTEAGVEAEEQEYPLTSSPGTEPHVTFHTPSPSRSAASPSRRPVFSPKTPPHWAEDQKSLLQMLVQQVEALKNEVHDLRHNSSDTTASTYRMYRDNYPAEGLQEGFSAAQTFHGVPLTVSTTGPSVYYNQSPAYNSQYLLRPAANVTPTKGPVYGMNRLPPQQHMYTYQQPTHTPPLQSTPACMYPQEQVFSAPLRFDSPATSLLSPYSEEYYAHNVPPPTVNPSLPEPGYFTKPSATTSHSSEGKSADPKMGFGSPFPAEPAKVPSFGCVGVTPPTSAATSAFKFNSNFKSNDGDFTFSSAQMKNSESLLGLLTSDIPSKGEGPSEAKLQAPEQPSSQSGVFTFGSKNSGGFSFAEGTLSKMTGFGNADQKFSFTSGDKPVMANPEEKSGESDNESTHVEEDEDGPHFEPIVPLPDKVDVKTGEEEEEEMFCKRAKLFRFDSESKEWKERGIGSIKILKHQTSGKVRLLMRREQVLKICANHYITADMALKPNAGSDKSWVWYAMDYADEMPKTEQLAIRFKTADEAALFKVKFEEAQKFLSESSQGQLSEKEEPPKPQFSSKEVDLKARFSKKEGEWDCDVCCVRNAAASAVCVACGGAGPSAAKHKPVPELKPTPAAPSGSKLFAFGLSGDSAKSTSSTEGTAKGLAFGSQIPISFKFGSSDTAVTPVGFAPQPDKKTVQVEAPPKEKVSAAPGFSSSSSGFGSQFVKKEGQWDCDCCLVRNNASATECVSCKAPCSTPKSKPAKSGLAAMFAKKDGQWDCDACLVRNEPASSHCVSCQTANPNMKSKTSAAPSSSSFSFSFASAGSQPAATGFTANFKSGPTFQFGTNKEKTSSEGFKFESSTAPAEKSASSFSFSMPAPAGGFKFGIAESEPKAEEGQSEVGSASDLLKNFAELHKEKEKESVPSCLDETDGHDDNPLITGKPNSFSFADLAKSSQGSFQFGQTDPAFKGFAGAGEKLFTGLQSGSKADTSADQEDDMYKTEENDDIQFEPVVQMPDKVDLVTGEEDEKTLYCQRVKLFRFDTETSQWKERGVGNLKLLKNNSNGKLRVLMRREQVLKVCANHWITTTMNLKPLSGSDRAWMWLANDFSDGDARLEQLAAKFKTPELAEEFKQKFEECQRLLLDIPLQTPHKLVNSGRTAQLIQKAEEMKSGLKDLKSFLTYQSKEDEDSVTASNTSSVIVKLDSETAGSTLEWDNYDLQEKMPERCAKPSTPSQPDPVAKNLFRFGESSAGFSFSFQPILSPSKSPSKLNQSLASVGTDDEQEVSQEEERDGQYFEPVVPLPDLVEVSTGEENEQVLFSHRAKLYRYDKQLSQWKERGIGDLKILQHHETKRVRLVMRRDQVLKLCANHWISSNMNLEPMKGAEKAWVWSAVDFAEGQDKVEQLAVRFKLQETANNFRDVFEEAKTAHEKGVLLGPISARAPPLTPETLCGAAAIAVLEETTQERSGLLGDSGLKPERTPAAEFGSPSSKTVVSPPKFVFGSDSMQKIFGSPSPLKEKSPSPIPSLKEEEESGASKLKTAGQAVSEQPSTPFSIPARIASPPEDPEADVQVVFERRPTREQAELASRLMLPLTFFCYQNEPGYESEDGSDDEDFETAVRNLKGKLYPDAASDHDSDCALVWEKRPTADEERRARRLQLPPTFLCGVSSDSEAEVELSADTRVEQTPSREPAEPQTDAGTPIDLSTRKSSETDASDTAAGVPFGFSSASSFSFADLAKGAGEFAFGQKDVNFSWSNAGATLFSGAAARAEGDEPHDEESDDETPHSHDIHFEPIVSLPEVDVKSGEEDEEILFKERTKLYRWDRELGEWKERGVGDVKLLFHPLKKSCRLLMRREQVLKVCANHSISADIDIKPMNTSNCALVWTATDFSEGAGRVEQLAARFKSAEVAEAFRLAFEQCVRRAEQDGTHVSAAEALSRSSNPRVFLSLSVDEEPAGRLEIELFAHIVPKTAENFRALCTGERGFGYRGSRFHRIIPDFMCQGGDITAQDGTGGRSIYGARFEDESFEVKHTGPGLLSMANRGRDTNTSQFFILLKKAEHLDFKHVAFGFVTHGMELLRRLGEMGTKEGKPTHAITVSDCGQI